MGDSISSILHQPTMKCIIVFATLLALALAAPLGEEAQITRYDSDNSGLGAYTFNFETSDGVSRQEEGHVDNQGSEDEILRVQGSYQYYGDDGQVYQVQYIADENGFQPQGAHIPHVWEAFFFCFVVNICYCCWF